MNAKIFCLLPIITLIAGCADHEHPCSDVAVAQRSMVLAPNVTSKNKELPALGKPHSMMMVKSMYVGTKPGFVLSPPKSNLRDPYSPIKPSRVSEASGYNNGVVPSPPKSELQEPYEPYSELKNAVTPQSIGYNKAADTLKRRETNRFFSVHNRKEKPQDFNLIKKVW
ncbi:hypothetical protein EDM53_02900 [Rickettsiales endosymbiont of Peranema trichophorum]|uniref:hypothetical protein n=1 Tax=Rickettsiales endosymbiont of Peranema trichophorum TaxID=2486577 RepID=UPI001022CDC8|nr:hypothetical protein [Rickettsiales endosymbiont of Peranema trichophorum]RZI47247.1 hypothetical protein EDM53_02900 [Rickettsiales endosymbiont of Peranema trichophorum]